MRCAKVPGRDFTAKSTKDTKFSARRWVTQVRKAFRTYTIFSVGAGLYSLLLCYALKAHRVIAQGNALGTRNIFFSEP